jgi:hypothetical protein
MDLLKKATLHGKNATEGRLRLYVTRFFHREVAVLVIDGFSYDAVYNSVK